MQIATCLQQLVASSHAWIHPAGDRGNVFDDLLATPVTGPACCVVPVPAVGQESALFVGRTMAPTTGGGAGESAGHEMAQQVFRATTGLQGLSAEHIEFSFVGGPLQGVQCRVEMAGTRVRCRMHSPSAVARKALRSAGGRLARRLAGEGLQLDGFEVRP